MIMEIESNHYIHNSLRHCKEIQVRDWPDHDGLLIALMAYMETMSRKLCTLYIISVKSVGGWGREKTMVCRDD